MATLTIRDSQKEALKAGRLDVLGEQACSLAAVHWPQRVAAIGEEGLRLLVRQGIDEAIAYGICVEQRILQYINVVLAFGSRLHDRVDLPWAAILLEDAELSSDDRITLLCKHAERTLVAANLKRGLFIAR